MHTLTDHPTRLLVIENALYSPNGIMVMGGLGLGQEEFINLPQGDDELRFLSQMKRLRAEGIATWKGLDFRHVHRASQAAYAPTQFGVIDYLGGIAPHVDLLSQSILDWLTLRDEKNPKYDILQNADVEHLSEYTEDEFLLAQAFRKQMVEQAEPHARHVAVGLYRMKRADLPRLDREIGYDEMRLYIHHRGILVSFVSRENMFCTFAWSPDGTNTSQLFVHPRATFAIDMVLACVWRDACVVQEKWSTRGQKHSLKGAAEQHPKEKRIVFPRTVYKSSWGNSDQEREVIEKVIRSAHAVRGCYPLLPEGYQAHDADERAKKYGWPAPPEGRTFRMPHTRGEGAVESADQSMPTVYCRGLQVAKILLG